MTFFLYLTFILFLIVCLFLILLVLIQKGRGGGLAGAFGGGGGNTAFGSKTGDVLTWATSIVFGVFLVLAIALNLLANNYNTAKTGTNTNAPTPANPGGPTAPTKGGNTSIPQIPPGSNDPGVLPKGPTTSK
jgi:preprotein translocase subunit SecG